MAIENINAVLNERDLMRHIHSGRIVITPLINPNVQIGPASIDIRLGFEFEVYNITKHTHIDAMQSRDVLRKQAKSYTSKVHVSPMTAFVLHPREFVLASTLEYFKIPNDIVCRLEGRSTWGRLGLQVHSTAGFVDPGFEGILTYELQNMGKSPLSLYPGVRIAQLCFFNISETAIPYTKKKGAKYFHKLGTNKSLFYEDQEFEFIRNYYGGHKMGTSQTLAKIFNDKEMLQEIEVKLNTNDSDLFAMLASEISKGIIEPDKQEERGKQIFENLRSALVERICYSENVKKYYSANDKVTLVAALIDCISGAVTGVSPVTFCVLLVKAGLDVLCQDCWNG
jgi:dCTP deaminase